MDNIAFGQRERTRIFHSENVAVIEQTNMLDDTRTYVLTPTKDAGFIVVTCWTQYRGYVDKKKYKIQECAAISVHVPEHASFAFKRVELARVLRKYDQTKDTWVDIKRKTRYDVKRVVTPGNT